MESLGIFRLYVGMCIPNVNPQNFVMVVQKGEKMNDYIIRSNNENMVIILSRWQVSANDYHTPLEEIKFDSIRLTFQSTARNADVVIIKDGKQFAVLKHNHMTRVTGQIYHQSSLTNIAFAR